MDYKKYISYYINASRAKGDMAEKLRKYDDYWEGRVNRAESENYPGSD